MSEHPNKQAIAGGVLLSITVNLFSEIIVLSEKVVIKPAPILFFYYLLYNNMETLTQHLLMFSNAKLQGHPWNIF